MRKYFITGVDTVLPVWHNGYIEEQQRIEKMSKQIDTFKYYIEPCFGNIKSGRDWVYDVLPNKHGELENMFGNMHNIETEEDLLEILTEVTEQEYNDYCDKLAAEQEDEE